MCLINDAIAVMENKLLAANFNIDATAFRNNTAIIIGLEGCKNKMAMIMVELIDLPGFIENQVDMSKDKVDMMDKDTVIQSLVSVA